MLSVVSFRFELIVFVNVVDAVIVTFSVVLLSGMFLFKFSVVLSINKINYKIHSYNIYNIYEFLHIKNIKIINR